MSAFRTIGTSDPRYERDGLRHVTFKCPSLKGRADVTLFIPDAVKAGELRDVPWVTLLHGVYGSHWAWALKGGAHVTAARLIAGGEIPPMVLAMPSDGLWGDGSGYVRHRAHASRNDYEHYIVDDLPTLVAEVVPGVTANSPRFITGLSMGGFGALRIGAKHGRRFRAIAGHSSITHFDQMARFVEEPLTDYGAVDPADRSVLETMISHRADLPAIRFDCGTDDGLIEENRALHRELTAREIPHEYLESPGAHEWDYWARQVEQALRWFGSIARQRLPVPSPGIPGEG